MCATTKNNFCMSHIQTVSKNKIKIQVASVTSVLLLVTCAHKLATNVVIFQTPTEVLNNILLSVLGYKNLLIVMRFRVSAVNP